MTLAIGPVLAELDGWQALAVISKALTYGSTFFTGGVLFALIFGAQLRAAEQGSIRRAVVWSAGLALLLSVTRIAIMNGMLGGAWSSVFDADLTRTVLQSKEGLATGLRLAGLMLVLIALLSSWSRWSGWSRWAIASPGVVLAVTSFAWTGHANAVGLAAQLLVALHLLAITYWLGALWPLYGLTSAEVSLSRSAAVMRRFGQIAIIVVGVLIAAGVLLLCGLLGSVDQMWRSAYGQMLVVKLVSVVLLMLCAAYNKLRLTPSLLRGEHSSLAKLRRSIQIEMALAAFILLVTAAITTLSGPTGLE